MEISDELIVVCMLQCCLFCDYKVGRGLMRNKDIGGEYIFTYMWQFQHALRKNDNNHVSYTTKTPGSCKKRRRYKQIWQGGAPRIHRKY